MTAGGAPSAELPGVKRTAMFAAAKSIAALGLRIRKGCSYHGLSLNVAMDLAPFAAINPCGYAGLAVTQTCDQGIALSPDSLSVALASELSARL